MKNIKPVLLKSADGANDWDTWLSEFEINLKEVGYKKYNQNHRNEDFCYWKTFYNGDNKIYQIGILFYDFRKHLLNDPYSHRIGTMYQCMLLGDERIDMDVCKEVDVTDFEVMAKSFFEAMSPYLSSTKLSNHE